MTDSIKKYEIGFTQIPNTMLCDPKLSERAKGIYAYLFSKPDGWQFHWNCMSKELNCSQRVFRAVISELEQAGYVTKSQVNENGKFGGMIYEFVDVDRVTQNPHTVFERDAKNGNTDYSNTDLPSNTYLDNNPPIIPPKPDDKFEEFWGKYIPVHTNKGPKKTAREKFSRLTKTVSADEIILGTERYIADCHKNNCYTKNVVTFLNQEQWKDFLEEPKDQSFRNTFPLVPQDYNPQMDITQVNTTVWAHVDPWWNENPTWALRIKAITDTLNDGSVVNTHQKASQMALELAKEIFRYKDSPDVKNSLVDPLFWFSHRSVIDSVFVWMRRSGLFYLGYQLSRLVENA